MSRALDISKTYGSSLPDSRLTSEKGTPSQGLLHIEVDRHQGLNLAIRKVFCSSFSYVLLTQWIVVICFSIIRWHMNKLTTPDQGTGKLRR
jgi:hypothetical protein